MIDTLTILLVEDNPDDAQRLHQMLQKGEVQLARLLRAECLEEALELVRREAVDLVLLDLGLPDSQGLGTLTAVPHATDAPVLALAECDDEEVAAEALRHGAQDYLVKADVTPRLLRKSIQYAIERQRAAQALQAERDRAERYLDVAGVMLLVIDREGTVTRINRKGCEILGCAEQDVVGKNWFEHFVPAHAQEEFRRVARALVEGDPQEGEYHENPVVTADGSERLIAWRNVPLHDAQGRPTGHLSSGEDITERRRAEEALCDSLQEIRQRQSETVALLEATGAALECDKFQEAARRIFDACRKVTGAVSGYIALLSADGQENELLFLEAGGLTCTVDPDLPMPVRGLRAEAYATGEVVYENDFMGSQWAQLMPPGHVKLRNVLFAPLVIHGEAVGVIGLANKPEDFTERDTRIAGAFAGLAAISLSRVRTEESLQESKRILDATGKMGRIGGWEYDPASGRIVWTQALYDIVGIPPDEDPPDLGEQLEYYAPGHREELRRAFKRATEEGEPFDLELQLRTPGGDLLWCRIQGEPVRKDGKCRTVRGTFQDISDRKRAEERLAESERYFRSLIYSLHEDILVIDREYEVTDVNNSFVQTAGMAREVVVGKKCYEVSHARAVPCSGDEDPCLLQQVFETGEPASCRHVHASADGSPVHVDIELSPIVDAHGNVTHVVEAMRDVTDLIRAHNELQEAEARYRAIFEGAAEGICVADAQTGQMLYANPAACRMFRCSRQELEGMNVTDTVPPKLRGWLAEEFEAHARGERSRLKDLEFLRKDGSTFYGDLTSAPVVINGRECIAGFFMDVTERKRSEDELRERNRFISSLLESLPVGVAVHDARSGAATYMNQQFEEIYGWPAEEIPSVETFFEKAYPDPARRAEMREQVMRDIQSGDPERMVWESIEITQKDGTKRVVSARNIPLEEQGMMVSTVWDVTERHELEEQLRQSQKMEAIGRLAGGIAHDFNNMLTGIKGCAGFALEAADEGTQQQEDLAEVIALADRAADLTRQLLAFSRRQALDPSVLNLNEVLSKQSKLLARLLGEDIQLSVLPNPQVQNVKADRSQIQQVIMNLAVNARDAMPKGGKLTIESANVHIGEGYARRHADVTPGDYVMVAVSDTGCGMDAKTREHVFDPFYTTKEVGKGTGLGLSTVYGIIKQHGGNITVYSEPGKGTTFKIYLPSVSGAAEDEDPPSAFIVGGSETVLLVEDDDGVRQVGRRHLEALGYHVLCACSARDALRVARQWDAAIDLLLTDVVMPDRNGRELYDDLAADRPGLKVVYMSGYTDNAVVHHGVLEEGVTFLGKPFERMELADKVRQALDQPR